MHFLSFKPHLKPRSFSSLSSITHSPSISHFPKPFFSHKFPRYFCFKLKLSIIMDVHRISSNCSLQFNYLCRKVVHLLECIHIREFGFHQFAFNLLKNVALAIATIIFAFGGVIIGGIAGAIKGQTTESGLCRGAAIGVMSGAIVALELLDSLLNGHFPFKVALFGCIFNGKAFRELVSPAVLKAYQWQTSMNEGFGNEEGSDLYNIVEIRGLFPEQIKKLPVINFHSNSSNSSLPIISHNDVCCTICLQGIEEGERARKLPNCQHLFHMMCIDEWLIRSTSCPVCRKNVVDSTQYSGCRNVVQS